VAGNDREQMTIRERLAAAHDRDEVVRILGKRRLVAYPAGFFAVALAATGYSVYVIVEVASRKSCVWMLAALPAFVAIIAFCGSIAYAGVYFVATGRRWPRADMLERIARRLNSRV
jgi:hypothetical protein